MKELGKEIKFFSGKLQRLIYLRKETQVLKLIESAIQFDGGLFVDDEAFNETRRLAWLLRINILQKWERFSEALAWTCLECELNPDNVAAIALKEQLKKHLNLNKKQKNNLKAPSHSNLTWEGVAGMYELKAIFERDIILPLYEPEIYKRYKVPLPNGVLLYGPPGCGKTFIARKLAARLEYSFYEVKPSDIASIYIHGTQEKIKEVFSKAAETEPSLIFFDEIEALVPNRNEGNLNHSYSSEVNEFLVQLNDCAQRKILVVAATNLPEKIDPAILRPGRIDKKILVASPDLEARAEAFKLYLKERPVDDIDFTLLAEESENRTYADIEFIVNEAARSALHQKVNISTGTLYKAITEFLISKDQMNLSVES
jgi:transitional endoplasmic reticulum ATPase